MRFLLLFFLIFQCLFTNAQNAESLFRSTLDEFKTIQTFSADVMLEFNIPSIHLERLKAKVYYQQPDKFRIKSQGIAFLPKQNPFTLFKALTDSIKYTIIEGGPEWINGTNSRQLILIPENDPEIVLAKIWVDPNYNRIQKSQISTKNNGTLESEYHYPANNSKPLPESLLFKFESLPFKIPKAMAADLNSKKKNDANKKERLPGSIKMNFSNYTINSALPQNIFKKK